MVAILLRLVAFIQLVALIRLGARLARGVGVLSVGPRAVDPNTTPAISIIVPVLNEVNRIGPCLGDLLAQDGAVLEILVVDGGSGDGTRDLVLAAESKSERIRLIEASPRPAGWNGKAWGLQCGLLAADPRACWIATVDADVRLAPAAVSSAVAFASEGGYATLSIATRQMTRTSGLSMLHPAMLTTLVYRFGIPGSRPRSVMDVQANGQFAIYRRRELEQLDGFKRVRASICEDVTLAREFFLAGMAVGFAESGDRARTEMHRDALDCLRNWPRSLPVRDQRVLWSSPLRLLEAASTQALPLPVTIAGTFLNLPRILRVVNLALAFARIGTLVGTRRAYVAPAWTYWLSPLLDTLAYGAIFASLVRRQHSWRGQRLIPQSVNGRYDEG
jgi:dolichol-phosphate mannosyltransferase